MTRSAVFDLDASLRFFRKRLQELSAFVAVQQLEVSEQFFVSFFSASFNRAIRLPDAKIAG
jgi:hypothetical protein